MSTTAASASAKVAQPSDVLAFWFDSLQPISWFRPDPSVDAEIRARFEPTTQAALSGALDAWADTAEGRLALILTLDQFTRNMYRKTPQAFAGDARAQKLTTEGVACGHDRGLSSTQKVFFTLPWEHAEKLEMQDRMVSYLTTALQEGEFGPDERKQFETFLEFAKQHRDVIVQFGRFPHRNEALGRESTAEEVEYLAKPGSGF